MEVSELINRTENSSWIEACLELPPNQLDPIPSSFTLIEKLITHKNVGVTAITDVVNRGWKPNRQIRVIRLDRDTYKFLFNHKADMNNAFKRRPWSIKGGHLILKHWNSPLIWQEIPFTTSTVWVQVHGLPKLRKSPSNLRKIGEMVGTVVELNLAGEGGTIWRKFLRVQIELDVLKPLMPGFFLPRENLPHLWISFKYEKIFDICYRCGIIGHEASSCHGNLFHIRNPFGLNFVALGPWLRSDSSDIPQGLFLKPDHQAIPGPTASAIPTSPMSTTAASLDEGTSASQDKKHSPTHLSVQAQIRASTAEHQPAVLSSTKAVSKDSNQQLACLPTHVNNTILPNHVNGADPNGTHELASMSSQQVVNLEAQNALNGDGDGPSYPPRFDPPTINHIICNSASNQALQHVEPNLIFTSPPTHKTNLSQSPSNCQPELNNPSLVPASSSPLVSSPHCHTKEAQSNASFPQVTASSLDIKTHGSNTLLSKRKATPQDLEEFSKRVKLVIHTPEAKFFDPKPVTVIPKSRVEHFILEERQNLHDNSHHDVQGEYTESSSYNET
nr:hypothetical protein CFP56_75832 [Quercus suber]